VILQDLATEHYPLLVGFHSEGVTWKLVRISENLGATRVAVTVPTGAQTLGILVSLVALVVEQWHSSEDPWGETRDKSREL
jgi:hypothetical protein